MASDPNPLLIRMYFLAFQSLALNPGLVTIAFNLYSMTPEFDGVLIEAGSEPGSVMEKGKTWRPAAKVWEWVDGRGWPGVEGEGFRKKNSWVKSGCE